jgi:hypothetical protein
VHPAPLSSSDLLAPHDPIDGAQAVRVCPEFGPTHVTFWHSWSPLHASPKHAEHLLAAALQPSAQYDCPSAEASIHWQFMDSSWPAQADDVLQFPHAALHESASSMPHDP